MNTNAREPLTAEEKAKIFALCRDHGISYSALADRFRCSRSVIKRAMAELSATQGPRTEPRLVSKPESILRARTITSHRFGEMQLRGGRR